MVKGHFSSHELIGMPRQTGTSVPVRGRGPSAFSALICRLHLLLGLFAFRDCQTCALDVATRDVFLKYAHGLSIGSNVLNVTLFYLIKLNPDPEQTYSF